MIFDFLCGRALCSGVKWVFLFNVRTSLIDIPFDLYDRPICQPPTVGRAHLYGSNAIVPDDHCRHFTTFNSPCNNKNDQFIC